MAAFGVSAPASGGERSAAPLTVDGFRCVGRRRLRAELSPRHQPDLVRPVAVIPRTLAGKRMEVPVKRVLLDPAAAATAEPGEPGALAEFQDLGRQLATAAHGARPGTQHGTRQAGAPHAT